MPDIARTSVLVSLFTLACGEAQTDSAAPEPRSCEPGWLYDDGTCVPEACGVGTWGDLPVDDSTVYVDAAAADGGDGSAEAPMRSIQAGLDLAGSRGGGLVAVAGGTYGETLWLSSEHDGVHLAGRCRDLVVVDTGEAESGGNGLEGLLGAGEARLSGVRLEGGTGTGLVVGSGRLSLHDVELSGFEQSGLWAFRYQLTPTTIVLQDCLFSDNTGSGITAEGEGVVVELDSSTIVRTRLSGGNPMGYGLNAYGGATITATDCVLSDNDAAAVITSNSGTLVRLERSTISENGHDFPTSESAGIWAQHSSAVELVDCALEDNAGAGVYAIWSGTSVTMEDTIVRDTVPGAGGAGGVGIQLYDGARLEAFGCTLSNNVLAGVYAADTNTVVVLESTDIRDIHNGENPLGYGIFIEEDASGTAADCRVTGCAGAGVQAQSGANIALVDTEVSETLHGAEGCASAGVSAYGGSNVSMEGCVLRDHTAAGLVVSGATATVAGVSITDTVPDLFQSHGHGVEISGGAVVSLEDCDVARNTGAGVWVSEPGTQVRMRGCTLRDTIYYSNVQLGHGLIVSDQAHVQATDCRVHNNTTTGISIVAASIAVRDVEVTDTRPYPADQAGTGAGIMLSDGGTLVARDMLLDRNADIGLSLFGCTEQDPQSCSQAILADVTIRRTTPGADGRAGYGIQVYDGAVLQADDLLAQDLWGAGIIASGAGTTAHIRTARVENTQAAEHGYGFGLQAMDGAEVTVNGGIFEGSTAFGVVADGEGSTVSLEGGRVSGTLLGAEEVGSVGTGLMAQQGGSITARALEIEANEGPGLYVVSEGSHLSCTDCTITHNRFGGAVSVAGGTLDLEGSTISDTLASANLGGGTGVYAAELGGLAPTLTVTGSIITGNEVAGLQLSRDLSAWLQDNTISGSLGQDHGATTRCGDGVYALETQAWDAGQGVWMGGNTISGNAGAGLFLDDAYATLDGNAWSENAPDLLAQGPSCAEPQADWAEADDQDICPVYDKPTCFQPFSFGIIIQDPEAGLAPPPRI